MRIVGVLLPELESPFSTPIISGILSAARQHGHRVVFFPGHFPGVKTEFELQISLAYRIADLTHMDGVVVFSAAMQHHMGNEGILSFLHSLPPIPMVSLGLRIPGVPSLTIDNYGGAFEAVRHLLADHRCQRVALIAGPRGHIEAEMRLEGWRDAHTALGLEADPTLIHRGTFTGETGELAMRRLLQSGSVFDAVFAVSDEMALGAMAVALDAGLQIPTDVRFAGFDDLLGSARFGVSLTSVRQPLFEMGVASANLLFDQLDGRPVEQTREYATQLLRRHSCGCATEPRPSTDAGVAALVAPLLQPLYAKAQHELHQAFDAAIDIDDAQHFAAAVNRVVRELLTQDGHTGYLRSLLLELNTLLARRKNIGSERLLRASCWLQRAALDVAQQQDLTSFMQYRGEQFAERHFRDLLKSRTATFNLQRLLDSLSEVLPSLSIDTCCIALYRGDGWIKSLEECHVPEYSQLIYAFINGHNRSDLNGDAFKTGKLLPDQVWDAVDPSASLAVFPVFHGVEHFGLIVFSVTGPALKALETIRTEVASSLKASLLVSELAAAHDLLRGDLDRARERHEVLSEIALVDELTGALNRRGFLNKAGGLIERLKNADLPVAVFFADIDGLKEINDQYGHAVGDAAIRDVAHVLKRGFRSADVIGRMGGDEFAVLATLAESDSLGGMRDRLYELFEQASQNRTPPLACSIGYVKAPAGRAGSLTELLEQADEVQYLEKKRRKSNNIAKPETNA